MHDETQTDALNLAEDFPPVPTSAWETAIRRDLKGADYEAMLVWRNPEGIAIQPYYRRDSLAVPIPALPVGRAHQAWEIIPSNVAEKACAEDSVRSDQIFEMGGNIVHQLGVALAQAVEMLSTLGEGEQPDFLPGPMRFVFAVGSDYFAEIAKLRAARLLWTRAVDAFGPVARETFRMHLHAHTTLAGDSERNMLRATTQAMSAVLGGCDSLSIEPAGFSQQLAMNIQHILAEEAHLGLVADPAAGSYYVESLTMSFARAAWKLFQRIEAAGGYTAARKDGWLSAEIARSRTDPAGAASSPQEQAR